MIPANSWANLTEEPDPARVLMIEDTLLRRLTSENIEALVALYAGTKDLQARYAAAGLLLWITRQKDERVTPQLQLTISRTALAVAKAEYPRTELSTRSYLLLEVIDPTAADEFILGIHPSGFNENEIVLYISSLKNNPSPPKVAKLQELKSLGGRIGRFARNALGDLGKLGRPQLQALAQEFRATRSTHALDKIFRDYIRFSKGKPIQPVLDLLGSPTAEVKNCVSYRSENPIAELKIWFAETIIIDILWS